jgi:hypothetical protein
MCSDYLSSENDYYHYYHYFYHYFYHYYIDNHDNDSKEIEFSFDELFEYEYK